MTETVIREGDKVATFINILELKDPAKLQDLIDVLNEGTEKVIKHQPGFISVNLFASRDGSRVVNLAQWSSPDDIKAVATNPDAQVFAKKAAELATPAPGPYSVASVTQA